MGNLHSEIGVNSRTISCKNTRYSAGKRTARKVKKTCKKWLTDGNASGTMVKLTREGKRKKKKNKKVLDKAKEIW